MPDGTARPTGAWRHRRARPAPPSGLPGYLAPNSVTEVRELAELIVAGEWAPASYRGDDGKYVVEKIVLGIMHGAAVGLGPFAAIHAIAVIDGHPTIWGDGALALVERSGLIKDMREDYTLDSDEGLTAICTIGRHPWPSPIARRFSMAMAQEAGLAQKEGPWQTYPRRMLMMRARSWALRDGFADVLRGLSIREEVEDYDRTAIPVPSPAPRLSAGLSPNPCRPRAPRPRLADYVATSGRAQSHQKNPSNVRATDAASGMHATERTEVPTRVPEDVSQSAATGHLSINEDNQIADPVIPAEVPETLAEPRGMSAPMLRTGDGIPDVATEPASQHSLIDAEGNFIEVGDLEELRDAFERLFADPYLSADQITGLWESNELARQHLTEAFGASSLEKARCRHLDAAVQRDRQPSIHSTEPKRAKHPSRKRLRSKQLKIVSSALTTQEVDLSIKIDTTWSDEKLLHHYQARLLALRLGRAKAQTFVNFRLANHAVEDRLRARLPHLMAAIDEVYAWASTQSR